MALTKIQPLATLRGIAKRYGGVQALAGIDIDVYPGRIHAICGENGAGKSTLMRIIGGAEKPDVGAVTITGRATEPGRPSHAKASTISVVFQELSLFPDLDVLANLFLRREPTRAGFVDRLRMRSVAAPILRELGLSVDPETPVGLLRLSEQQLVEIARALLTEPQLLIFDEPNSALTAVESERLFSIVRKLRQRGIAILFVSHRLEEIFALCDWITVLRNGEKVSDTSIGQTNIAQVVAEMVGPIKRTSKTVRRRCSGAAALTFENATLGNELNQVSFEVRAGEIVGLAGLEGSGSTAPFDALFGRSMLQKGEICLPDKQALPRSPQEAVKARIALVPADRRTEGLSVDQDIVANMMAVAAGALGRCGFFLSRGELDRRTTARADALRLARSDLRQAALNLSGGNQQKLVLGKWLETNPQILLLDDPTRGVDIAAKAEIHRIIGEEAAVGRIILFHSTEFQEYAEVCDRVLVFYRGRIVAELNGDEITEHALLQAANVGQINPGASL